MPRPIPAGAKAKTARRDPPARALDATQPILALKNRDPDRVYVNVFKAEQQHGIEYYEYLGYRVETGRKDGPQWAMGQTHDGQPMERLGHVLMSCSAERHQEIMEEGGLGEGGLRIAREQEAHIFSKRGRAPGTDGEPERLEDDAGNRVMDWELPPATRMTVIEE